MLFMQSLKSLCTESLASFEYSQEPTEWRLSSHRTQVISMSLDVTFFVLVCFVVIKFLQFLRLLKINFTFQKYRECVLQCLYNEAYFNTLLLRLNIRYVVYIVLDVLY